ncbi:MAG: putative membrane protein SirB2, partial [Glaciecola sp.]
EECPLFCLRGFMLMLKRSQNFNVLSIFPKLINNILRLSAIAVYLPVNAIDKNLISSKK